jgi:hypothetical protein
MHNLKMIEGVSYYRFVVRFRLADGRERRWFRWSPGHPWVRDEIGRELHAKFGADGVQPGSATIRLAP